MATYATVTRVGARMGTKTLSAADLERAISRVKRVPGIIDAFVEGDNLRVRIPDFGSGYMIGSAQRAVLEVVDPRAAKKSREADSEQENV